MVDPIQRARLEYSTSLDRVKPLLAGTGAGMLLLAMTACAAAPVPSGRGGEGACRRTGRMTWYAVTDAGAEPFEVECKCVRDASRCAPVDQNNPVTRQLRGRSDGGS
jgi:hypothetical protein